MKRFLLMIVAVAAAIAVGMYCWTNSTQATPTGESEQSTRLPDRLAVEYVHPVRQAISERIELVGSLEPRTRVEIRTSLSEYIRKLPFDVGDRVGEDVLLAELDDARYQALHSAAEASLLLAESQLKAKQAQAEQAQREVERNQVLADRGVSTVSEQEAAKSALQVLLAEVELERARVAQARAETQRTQWELEQCQLVSPIRGFVAERFRSVGDLAEPTQPLLTLVDLSTVSTVVHVTERNYHRVRVGQVAIVTTDALPQQRFAGQVVRKAPVLSPETRTAAVHIEIPNDQTLLKPGMHARVELTLCSREDALVVPRAALFETENGPAVYVLKPKDAPDFPADADADAAALAVTTLQQVQLGIRHGDLVEIRRGLSPQAAVVTLGSRLVEPNSTVDAVRVELAETPSLQLAIEPKGLRGPGSVGE